MDISKATYFNFVVFVAHLSSHSFTHSFNALSQPTSGQQPTVIDTLKDRRAIRMRLFDKIIVGKDVDIEIGVGSQGRSSFS